VGRRKTGRLFTSLLPYVGAVGARAPDEGEPQTQCR
jgi:hypothetical protein